MRFPQIAEEESRVSFSLCKAAVVLPSPSERAEDSRDGLRAVGASSEEREGA
jgi:hypothetical protein